MSLHRNSSGISSPRDESCCLLGHCEEPVQGRGSNPVPMVLDRHGLWPRDDRTKRDNGKQQFQQGPLTLPSPEGRGFKTLKGTRNHTFISALLVMIFMGPLHGAELITNPGFEQVQNGLPTGWILDDKVGDKGAYQFEGGGAKEGKLALKLAPNAKNTDPDHYYGFGQLIAGNAVLGKKYRFEGWVKNQGGAVAILVALVMKQDGKMGPAVFLLRDTGTEWSKLSDRLAVGEDCKFLIVGAVCKGTQGNAWFDDLRLEEIVDKPKVAVLNPFTKPVKISIEAGRSLRKIPRTLFGINMEWIENGQGAWDEPKKKLDPDLVALTRELSVSVIRYPGGGFSDFYHWLDGVGPLASRPLVSDGYDKDKHKMNFGSNEFLQFCGAVGGEPLIEINAGTGTAKEAADWVKFLNGQGGTHRRARFFEIGNELYMNDPGGSDKVTVSPDKYAARFLEFAAAMRVVDPGIKLGAIGGENYGKYAFVNYPDWNKTVLTQCGAQMDYLCVHNSYGPALFADPVADVDTVYASLLAQPMLVKANMEHLDRQIKEYATAYQDKIKIAVTEWGPLWSIDLKGRWTDHNKTLGSALFTAGLMNTFLRHSRVDMANYFKLSDQVFMGMVSAAGVWWANDKTTLNHQPKGTYYAFQMYSRHFGEELVGASTDSPSYASEPVGVIGSVDQAPYVEAVASRSADGKKLYIMVLNRSQEFDAPADIRVAGFKASGKGKAWTLWASAIDSNNGPDLPQVPGFTWVKQASTGNGGFDAGKPGTLTIRETKFSGKTYTFPKHSLVCLEYNK